MLTSQSRKMTGKRNIKRAYQSGRSLFSENFEEKKLGHCMEVFEENISSSHLGSEESFRNYDLWNCDLSRFWKSKSLFSEGKDGS